MLPAMVAGAVQRAAAMANPERVFLTELSIDSSGEPSSTEKRDVDLANMLFGRDWGTKADVDAVEAPKRKRHRL